MAFIARRKGYSYAGFLFSEDGKTAQENGIAYREHPFSSLALRRFHFFIASVILITVLGIPLLAYWGLNDWLIWLSLPMIVFVYWGHQRIHCCSRCGRRSRVVQTPHMDSPVLYLCRHCRCFFEHGSIDGGLPWK
jgi:hypothetical protein